jgi:hypothetical protein
MGGVSTNVIRRKKYIKKEKEVKGKGQGAQETIGKEKRKMGVVKKTCRVFTEENLISRQGGAIPMFRPSESR